MPQILPMSITLILILLIMSMILMISLNEFSWWSTKKKKMAVKKSYLKKFFLSLFVSFDPSSSFLGELNWIILIIVPFLFIVSYWKKPTRINIFLMTLKKKIEEQFKIALKSTKDSSATIFISLYFLILAVNVFGLFPNMFTPTSHITMNIILSFPMWLGFALYGWLMFTNKMLAHLVPSGTPTPLISFMVLIEMISNFIRSLTLSIRLMANMISGHLLLTLMGNMMEKMGILILLILILIQGILSSLELGVAFIQSYVFSMLMTLYSDDSDLKN